MTESNRSLSEVPGLIAERRRYESWLEALAARRDSTPVHVYERVQADYRLRLQRVAEQLASFRQVIEDERTNVDSRLSLLEAEERMRRDERAELELRSHVGELAGEEATSAFNAVDETIGQLVTEKGGLQGRIAELDALLDIPDPVLVASAAPAQVVEEPKVEAKPEPVVAEKEEPVAHAAAAESHEQAPPPAVSEPEQPPVDGPHGRHTQPVARRASTTLRTASGSFDELKFLNTVVGKEEAAAAQQSAASAAAPAASGPATSSSLTSPSGGQQSGTPIGIRASGTLEQTKTLKCSECGAANYPTEWYCERCGAELAAL